MSDNQLKVAVIRQELIELTGDYRQALILNQFIYWTSRVRDHDLFLKEEHGRETNSEIEFRNGWIYKTAEELASETMLGLSPSNMRKHIKTLVEKGWLQERRNPKYKWDKTLQYRVDSIKLKNDMYDLGYSINIDTDYRVSVLENRVTKIENQTTQNEKAIPEIINKDYNSENTNNNILHHLKNDDILHNLDELNHDRYIFIYLETMKDFGYKHKRISDKNFDYIKSAINEVKECDIDIEDWQEKVEEHFEKLPKSNDGDILAFLKAAARYFEVNIDCLARVGD